MTKILQYHRWMGPQPRFVGTATITALILSTLFFNTAEAASPKVGSACKKAGLTQKGNGVVYICKKSGKKLVWAIALGIRKSPFPTPSPSASQTPSPSPSPTPTQATPNQNPQNQNSQGDPITWNWMNSQGKWVASATPPECTLPIIPTGALLDFTKPVSILQPGQIRGGSYKPHGGLRWSVYGTYIEGTKITVPFDGTVVQAWQYIEMGTYQFGVNIQSPCGFMVRMDHLLVPSAQFSEILKTIPPAAKDDSRETSLSPPIQVKTGDAIAKGVGMPPPAGPDSLGTFIDLGLLDLRHPNLVLTANFSTNADEKYSKYSVCWYQGGYLSPSDQALAQKLPFANSDPTSAYCSK